LRGQLNDFLLGCFAEAEVCDFDSSLVEEDVLRFQIVVNDFVGQIMEISDCVNNLPDDKFGFLFRQFLVFAQVVGQIGSFAKLQNSAERGGIYFDSIV
jgi:hypothetical protein